MLTAVSVENVSKVYRLDAVSSDSLNDTVAGMLQKLRRRRRVDTLWALRNVSFQVPDGQALGVIGRNGAGKSTLLKLLSRITEPTHGKIKLHGRVSSLLEVGTGFHPELTGRENIYLNGSILGMKRAEIRKKFDEIVAFSGVQRFLETPVKRFSSGMYVRLAFSVAAHLEPEILIIDEVLAVGDAEFQRKCLGKMSDAARQGRTVLFVSHNMSAVESLCGRAIYLENGEVRADGPPRDVISTYLQQIAVGNAQFVNGGLEIDDPTGLIKKVTLLCDGRPQSFVYTGCEMELRVDFVSPDALRFPVLGFSLKDRYEGPLIAINNKHYQDNLVSEAVDRGSISMRIPSLPLMEGSYVVDLFLGDGSADVDIIRSAFVLNVEGRRLTAAGQMPNPNWNKFCIRDIQWAYLPPKKVLT